MVSKNVSVDVNVADLMKYPLVGHRSRVRRAQFESLEPRLHLSADPSFTFFQTATFDFIPHASESTEVDVEDLIYLRAARGEIESMPVGLSAAEATTLQSATFSDLTNSAGDVLPANQLDLRVVHLWEQYGIDRLWEEDTVLIPELLLYDDTQALLGRFDYTDDASPLLEAPVEDEPVAFVADGKASVAFDNSLLLHNTDSQTYAGTFTFEFRDSWDGDDTEFRYLAQLNADNYNQINLFHNPTTDGDPGLTAVLETCDVIGGDCVTANDNYTNLSVYGGAVEAGTWTEVGLSYQVEPDGAGLFTLSLSLSVGDQASGVQQKLSAAPLAADSMSDIFLGSTFAGTRIADGYFRNLKFYDEFVENPLDSTLLPTPVFELALDDAEALATVATSLEAGHYVGPTLKPEFLLELDAEESRQLWLTANVPETTPSGIYTGLLTLGVVSYAGEPRNDTTQVLPVTLEVLPFDLLDSERIHGTYFNVSPQGELPTETIDAQLENLAQHGVNALYLQRYFDVDSVAQLLSSVEEKLTPEMVALLADDHFDRDDFETLVQQYTGTADGFEQVGDDGVEYYIYTTDEPNPPSACINGEWEDSGACLEDNTEVLAHMMSHMERAEWIHTAGGQTTTALLFQTQELFADPDSWFYTEVAVGDSGETYAEQGTTSEPVDLPVYHATELGSMTPPFGEYSGDQPLFEDIETRVAATDLSLWQGGTSPVQEALYYWQSWIQKPALNRTKTGLFLAYSGFRGVAPYTYVCVPASDGVENNPFDESVPTGYDPNDGDEGVYRRLCTVYPASDGVIDTVGWEAYREGVDDLRYLKTLEQALEDNLANVHQDRRTEILAELRQRVAAYAAFPYSGQTETDLAVDGTQAVQQDADREFMIEAIQELLYNAPVAVADNGGTVDEGGVLSGQPSVLTNDTDADFDTLTAILVTGPSNASAFELNSVGTFSYSHDGSETTLDSFTYKANDGVLDSNTVTVSITITPVTDPQDVRWDGDASVGTSGDGTTWADANNWSANGLPDVAPVDLAHGDHITFQTSPTIGIIDLGEDRTVNSLTFENSYTLASHNLTMTTDQITVNADVVATINSNIVGNNGLSKKGTGILLINGTGPGTTVEAGTLGGSGTLESLTVQNGATVAPGTVSSSLNAGNSTSDSTLGMKFAGTTPVTLLFLPVTSNVNTFDDEKYNSETLTLLLGTDGCGSSCTYVSQNQCEEFAMFHCVTYTATGITVGNYLDLEGDVNGFGEVSLRELESVGQNFGQSASVSS
ncbi:MAG: cadherin-like domain-containing protein [Pirellulaceae bacterium]|nr:cadherin-like domain-containing protein [Pirellulaceae bacterium]